MTGSPARDYCMYLRKSRVDLEAEAHGQGDTLLRHRTRLLNMAHSLRLNVTKIYEEVRSGETITSRPVMQQLLHDVEAGLWAGVLVMEVERLARGDTIDQGLVARAFNFSGTKIITPTKTYDPSSEFDQEYFEFGLFMSRREYKTINRRQQAGRLASVNEGKWPANKAPYGYDRVKLEGQKGWTLKPNDKASVVADIFRWFTDGAPDEGGKRRLGTSRICNRLNNLGIPSPGGRDWAPYAIRAILSNPAYAGYVRWGHRPAVKQLSQDHIIVISRKLVKSDNENLKVVKGLHPPIISQEVFDRAQALLSGFPSHPGPKQLGVKSPLSGLVVCDQCGRHMIRRPYQNGYPDSLICPYTSCPTKGSELSVVERAVLQAMRDWLCQFEHEDPSETDTQDSAEIASLTRTLAAQEKELEQIDTQMRNAFDLVERGVYTVEIFTARNAELSRRRAEAEASIFRVQQSIDQVECRSRQRTAIAPAIRRVLDSYKFAATPQERNDLLREVLDHVEYHKLTGGRWRESDMAITIYPRLPF